MKRVIALFILGILFSTILISGCGERSEYELKKIFVDPPNIKINSNQERVDICFDIKNNAKTTLIPQIEVLYDDLGNKCLEKKEKEKINEVIPGGEKHTCTTLSLKWDVQRNSNLEEECKEKNVNIRLELQDITGVKLAEGSTSLGII